MNGPIVPIIRGPGNVILEQLSAIPVGTTALAVERDSDTRGRIVPFNALTDANVSQAIAAVSFEHVQTAPSDQWTINHNLGFKPTVAVLSPGGMEVDADIHHASTNQTTVYFNSPFSGSARLT